MKGDADSDRCQEVPWSMAKMTGQEMERSWKGNQESESYLGIPLSRGRMRAMGSEDDKLAEFHVSAFNQ